MLWYIVQQLYEPRQVILAVETTRYTPTSSPPEDAVTLTKPSRINWAAVRELKLSDYNAENHTAYDVSQLWQFRLKS